MNEKIRFVSSRRVPPGRSPGVKGFVSWIRQEHPKAYAELRWQHPKLIDQANQLDGLGDVAPTSGSSVLEKASNIATQIASVVQPFLQLDAQRKLLKVQTQRAAAGLAPLDTSQISLPPTRVQIDAGPSVTALKKPLLIGLGIVGAFALWKLLQPRRR